MQLRHQTSAAYCAEAVRLQLGEKLLGRTCCSHLLSVCARCGHQEVSRPFHCECRFVVHPVTRFVDFVLHAFCLAHHAQVCIIMQQAVHVIMKDLEIRSVLISIMICTCYTSNRTRNAPRPQVTCRLWLTWRACLHNHWQMECHGHQLTDSEKLNMNSIRIHLHVQFDCQVLQSLNKCECSEQRWISMIRQQLM